MSEFDVFIMTPAEKSAAVLKRENRFLMKRETLDESTYFLNANCER